MNNSDSSITVNNNDKTSTTFNFKFENGLPIRPIITPDYSITEYEKDSFALSIYLSDEEIKNIKKYHIDYYSVINGQVLLSLDHYHIVFLNLDDQIIEKAIKKSLALAFFTKEQTFIKGIQFE